MRLIKMLRLAAVAATLAMALVEASTASANSETIDFCKTAELVCENPFPNPTTIIAHAKNPVFLDGALGNMECKESLLEVELLSKLGTLGIGHVKAQTFTGECHIGGTKCTITVGARGDLSFTKAAPLSANVAWILSESGAETTITLKCGFSINCTYGGSPTTTASSTAGGETVLTLNKALREKSSGLCPEFSAWDATYVVLGAMWIES